MSWKKGPLPAETWGWGGVTVKGDAGQGFYFGDFQGDKVVLCPEGRVLKADEVGQYNNAIQDLPANVKGRAN
jgi:hypothetical protein